MRVRLTVPPLSLALVLATAAPARSQVLIDLAVQKSATTTTRPVEPGRVSIALLNLLPAKRYDISVRRESIPIKTLTAPSLPWLKALEGARKEADDPCARLVSAVAALHAAAQEDQVPALAEGVQAALDVAACAEPEKVQAARVELSHTTRALDPTPVGFGERLVITVQREAEPGTTTRATWTTILDAGPRGEWLTMYGVTFVDDRDKNYVLEPAGAGKFVITPERDEDSLTLVPSIFYSWLPAAQQRRNWSVSPTAGLGLSKNAAAVFVGGSALYNHNIGFVAGLAVYGQRRLAGRYTAGQMLTENLTGDQLHKRVYRPGWMVALTFRFGSNPFEKPTSEQPPAPADAGGTGTPAAKPPAKSEQPGTEEAAQAPAADPDVKVRFDASGRLLDDSQGTVQQLTTKAASATDIFVVSHGWWHDAASADCFYRRLIGALRASQPAYLTADRFQPLFVAVYWPSATLTVEPGECQGASAQPAVGRGESSRPESRPEAVTADRLRDWAARAFPGAARQAAFPSELSRLTALLSRETQGGTLSREEAAEIVSTLTRWRQLSQSGQEVGPEGPEAELFQRPAGEIVQRWDERLSPRAESAPETFGLGKWMNFANAFTFWTMKERAGVVGSQGLYEVVGALQAARARGARVHLLGHSFGGKLLSAALTGHGRGRANRVDSFVILQGAFSQFAFATAEAITKLGVTTSKPGLYVNVQTANLVTGPLVVTFSSRDLPNRVLYPAGVAIVDDVLEASRTPRYGSLGARGIRGVPALALDLAGERLRDRATTAAAPFVSVEASQVILGHSDFLKKPVFDLIWDAVEVASARTP